MSAVQQLLLSSAYVAKPGQSEYITPGTYSWVCPLGVTSVSLVCISGGASSYNNTGGHGGGLLVVNNIPVTPGTSYNVLVGDSGGNSHFHTYVATGASVNTAGTGTYSGGLGKGVAIVYGGYMGSAKADGGGGGAAGYSGNGGDAGNPNSGSTLRSPGSPGMGGGGGGGAGAAAYFTTGGGYDQYLLYPGGSGGGTGIYGLGANGAGGNDSDGGAGSGGSGKLFGGGGGGNSGQTAGGSGAVRIIWPGNLRQFPSTRTADE